MTASLTSARKHFGFKRIAGLLLSAALISVCAMLVWRIALAFDSEIIAEYGGRLFHGLGLTVAIVAIALAAGAIIAAIITAMRFSRLAPLRWFGLVYCYVLRGTPLLAKLYLVYYGAAEIHSGLDAAGLWTFFREPMNCVLLTFSLNTAAYQAEIMTGAIRAVPIEQVEAARALSLSRFAILWKVVLPQAMIVALRPLGNEVAKMLKASALASVVTVLDLLGTTGLIYARTFDFDVYLVAAAIYLALVEGLRLSVGSIESRLIRHMRMPAISR